MPTEGRHTVSEDGGGNWVAWFGKTMPKFYYQKFAEEVYPDEQGINADMVNLEIYFG